MVLPAFAGTVMSSVITTLPFESASNFKVPSTVVSAYVPDNLASACFTIGTGLVSVVAGGIEISVVTFVSVLVSSSLLSLQETVATEASIPILNKNFGEKNKLFMSFN